MPNVSSSLRYFLLIIFFIPALTLADINHEFSIGIDAGAGSPANLGKSAQFPLGYSTFSYSPNHTTSFPFYGGIAVDKNIWLIHSYQLQAGLNYSYLSYMSVSGTLSQGVSPPYYQTRYSYAVNSTQLLAEAKLRYLHYQKFFPYFILGLGVAFNNAQHFSTNVPPYLTVTPTYANNKTNAFAYAIGFGFDYQIHPKLSLGLVYRLINLGDINLGTGIIRNTSVSSPFNQSNVCVNTLALHVNWLI